MPHNRNVQMSSDAGDRCPESNVDVVLPDPAPFVSIVLPVRNEAAFIQENLRRLLQQDYPPDRFEIIVADGMSNDGTRKLVEEIAAADTRVRVVDNPQQIAPTGMNILIGESRGEIILRMDGHTYVAEDFVKQSVLALVTRQDCDVWAVGGPIVNAAQTSMGQAIALAMSHPLGVGNAHHRNPHYEGFGEGTAFPAMYAWVFDRIGLYDESLVRNQDDEFYFRIGQGGGKFFITPRIRYTYFVRERLQQLFRQYYQYSFWRIPVILKHRQPTTFRQVVPSLFYLAMGLGAFVGLALSNWWVALLLPVVYLGALLLVGLSKIPSAGFAVALRLPMAIVTMHAGYAWGMIYGWLCQWCGLNPWKVGHQAAKLSR